MIHFNLKKYIPFILLLCLGCENKNKFKIEYYPNGNIQKIYSLENDKKNGKEILYYENGNIKSITNFIDNLKDGEQLNFYENNGLLKTKLLLKKDNIPNGVAYWFYESGALKASRNYVNGRPYDVGFDYWDYGFVINKSLERFNDNGKVYYKLNFDSSGKPTTSEGDSLHSGLEDVK